MSQGPPEDVRLPPDVEQQDDADAPDPEPDLPEDQDGR